VLNKNKPADRSKKVMMINASEKFKPLKKNKGKKRKKIDEESRLDIVKTLSEFKDNEYAKVFDREFFFYNKQAIMLTNLDENGKSMESVLPVKKDKDGVEKREKSIKLSKLERIVQIEDEQEICIEDFEITEYKDENYKNLKAYDAKIKAQLALLDYKEKDLKVYTKNAMYWFDSDKETIVKEKKGEWEELGCGKIVVKSAYKKATKTHKEKIVITVELTPDFQKDYEIIPYNENPAQNQRIITEFMEKYITKPFEYLENTVGVEINFNRIFYHPEQLRPLQDILNDLTTIGEQLNNLEAGLEL
jgi:type I restriction enzyme M protein